MKNYYRGLLIVLTFLPAISTWGQGTIYLPERVFDGHEMHKDWAVAVEESLIVYAGPKNKLPSELNNFTPREMPGKTMLPGLIEGHAHLLLYPYNQRAWNEQVLNEAPELRAIRGAEMAKITLRKGVTTVRDLGSEGAGYADVALRDAIDAGIISGPDLIVAGPAIVATGSYGPKGFHPDVDVPLGAQEADGIEGVTRVTREQIGKGADFIKVYADYRWGPNGTAQPTFTLEELKTMVAVAQSSGRVVVAHAATEEGMRRAILAGVQTIEHGDMATRELLEMMKEREIGYCPTLGAVEAITDYFDQDNTRITQKKETFALALEVGVPIVFGGDVGVFPHGENTWELELMVEYGMKPIDALRSATSGNAQIFALNDRGVIANGKLADLMIVNGDPMKDIAVLRDPELVIKRGNELKD